MRHTHVPHQPTCDRAAATATSTMAARTPSPVRLGSCPAKSSTPRSRPMPGATSPSTFPYDHRTILFGGPVGWICSGIASVIGNRRSREAAERIAAPQWRYLGHLPIIVTNRRLLVWFDGDWWPVWLDAVTCYRRVDRSIYLDFDSSAPYRLETDMLQPVLAVLDADPAVV